MTKQARKNIKIEMIKRNLSGIEVSKRTGIPPYIISQILSGRVNPTSSEADLFAKTLGKSPEELFEVN